MCEHLFRGKRADNGEWVCGFLTGDTLYKIHRISYGDDIVVLPKTIGRCTGLTDKNGVKIFEGDIVEVSKSEQRYVIKWLSKYSCFAKTRGTAFQRMSVFPNHTEVIGNIFDNPELVGGEKNICG